MYIHTYIDVATYVHTHTYIDVHTHTYIKHTHTHTLLHAWMLIVNYLASIPVKVCSYAAMALTCTRLNVLQHACIHTVAIIDL